MAEPDPVPDADGTAPGPLVPAERLLAVADGPPLAPEEPDSAGRGLLLPLELLAWDGDEELVGVRCGPDGVVLRSGRPPSRRQLRVKRLTRWARAGRVTLHGKEEDVELRLLSPSEYAEVALGDTRQVRVAGPVRIARSGQLSGRRDDVTRAFVARVARVVPDLQIGNG